MARISRPGGVARIEPPDEINRIVIVGEKGRLNIQCPAIARKPSTPRDFMPEWMNGCRQTNFFGSWILELGYYSFDLASPQIQAAEGKRMPDAIRGTRRYQQSVRWQLELGGVVIARIDADEHSFPFTYGHLVESPEFERFRHYFTDDNDWPEDDPALESLCGEVQDQGGFLLRELPSGVAYRSVRLNHNGGNQVWFRHGDPA